MVQIISATRAREKFAEIINRVLYGGEEFIVEKQGKPTVLITRAKAKKRIKKVQKDPGTEFLAKIARYKAKGLPKDLAKNLDKYVWEEYSSR